MTSVKALWRFVVQHPLIWIGLAINISFYLSAYQTHWYDYFFSGSSLQLCCRGLDFDAVPNGAYSFFHGGNIVGNFAPSGPIYTASRWFLDPNQYHPLFTLVVGSLLIQIPPLQSFFIWMFSKFFVTIAMVIYFYKEFGEKKYADFAIFLLLASFTQYDEIRIAQYQSLFNFFAFLLLIRIAKEKDTPFLNGVLYFLTLMVKPISLLWLPVLLFKGQYRAAWIGSLLFVLVTAPLFIRHSSMVSPYMNYVVAYITHPDPTGPIQIITLDALLRYSTSIPWNTLDLCKILFWSLVVFLSSFKRVHILKVMYFSAIYFLLFSGHVYEYYYTILIAIFAVAVVTCEDFQKVPALILMILASCPSIFFILRYFNIGFVQGIYGPDPTFFGWQLLVVSKVLPLACLTLLLIVPDVKPVYASAKVFFAQLREINKKLQTFG